MVGSFDFALRSKFPGEPDHRNPAQPLFRRDYHGILFSLVQFFGFGCQQILEGGLVLPEVACLVFFHWLLLVLVRGLRACAMVVVRSFDILKIYGELVETFVLGFRKIAGSDVRNISGFAGAEFDCGGGELAIVRADGEG